MSDIEKLILVVLTALTCPLALPMVIEVEKKKMSDLISRQEAIDGKISIQRANGVEIYSDEAVPVEYLKRLPSAEPVRHGKWIIEDRHVCCSECGEISKEFNYCPYCGARMDEHE